MYIGIFKAKQVVVLADNTSLSNHNQLSNSSSQGLDALVDADAIFCYQCVRRMNEQAHIVVEIVRHTNVSYLGKSTSSTSISSSPQHYHHCTHYYHQSHH